MASRRIQRSIESFYSAVLGNKRLLLIAAAIIFLFALFGKQLTSLIVLVVLGAVASFTVMYKRVVRLPPALELITLTSAVVTIVYGMGVGIVYTVIVNIISEVVSGHPDEMSLTYLPCRIAQVLFVHLFRSHDFVTIGIWSNVVFNAVQQPIFMMLTGPEKRFKSLYFVFLNIPLNILIFKFFGMPLLTLVRFLSG